MRYLICFAAVSVLLLGIDGAGQWKKRWLSTNPRRLVTGLLCGCSVTAVNIKLIITLARAAFP